MDSQLTDAMVKKSLEERVERAQAASEWLKNPTLNAALANMRLRTIGTWAASLDPAEREQCWQFMQCIDTFATELRALVDDPLPEIADKARKEKRRAAEGR